jgi:hypothetical protein
VSVEWISDFFFSFIGGFARIFIAVFVLWMIGIVLLLLKELFSSDDFEFRPYIQKIGRILLLAFQVSSFGSVPVGILMLFQEEPDYLINSMIIVDGIILSFLYFYVRKKIGSQSAVDRKK